MRRTMQALVFITVIPTLFAPVVRSQEEQWLQYRSSNEAAAIIGSMRSVYYQVGAERPEGIKLPEFTCERPLFYGWNTPMAQSGKIWLAFDASSGPNVYDRLYIDANGDGDLSDEPPYEPYRRDSNQCYFGPVKIVFDTEDGPVTYHLRVQSYSSTSQNYCVVTPACWYEGPVTLDGEKKHCVLIDFNGNGTFNDKSTNAGECDYIRIGPESSRDSRYVGNYIEVDDKLYRTQIARDGAFIILSKADDVPYGTVRLAEAITGFAAAGENGLFLREPKDGTIRLPVGDYRVDYWSAVKKDDSGAKWELRGQYFRGDAGNFTVAESKETVLPFGEPVHSAVSVQQSGSYLSFGQSLEGRHGERIDLTRNGSRPQSPKLRIRNRDGTYDRGMSFEYG